MPAPDLSPLQDPRFRASFANAAVGIAVVDLSGFLLDVNPAFCRISGYTSEEISGIGFGVFIDTDEQDQFARLVAGEIPGYVVERRFPRKDGTAVFTQNSVSLLHDLNGNPACAMAIIEDLTEKRHLEELARQSHKMEALGRLAGGVAHDFNNLLMIINSYAALLKEDFGLDTPAGGKAQAIEEAGTRAAVLTRQLLAFSRKQVLQTQVISIDELVRSSEQMLRRLIRENITFSTQLAAGDACIDADLGQIQQVLMNLAVNASDAMPNGGQLTLQTRKVQLEAGSNGNGKIKPGPYVLLSVADTGVGMDAATQVRIFEPFFTTKGQGKGTGLGLATVFGIIDQSGGHITVESTLGRGAVFTIYLPAVPRESSKAAIEIPSSRSRKQIRATVLLVEDEEILRRCLLNSLSSMGCFVLQARDGEHALELARRQLLLIDLVVTDMVMPRMGGRDLVNSLREIRPKMPVIFMSGYTDVAPTREELRSGATLYVQKPFTTSTLRKSVEEILAVHRARVASR
jgi:PAS domain S-box-containing protein